MTTRNVYEQRVRRVRTRCAEPDVLCGAADAARVFRTFTDGEPREVFLAMSLDSRNRCIGIERVAVGCVTSVPVIPAEVFRAVILAGGVRVIVAHNHPSGDPQPSAEDLVVTRQLAKAGRLLGLPLLDHVIVTEDGHVSLAETTVVS